MFKKSKIALFAAAAAAIFTLSGCFCGSSSNPDQNYACLKAINKFNTSMKIADSDEANKWINAVLGFFPGCIVYWIGTGLGDILVFNSIAFWTGSNPLASTTVTDADGVEYQVARNDSTLTITNLSTNESAEFSVSENGEALVIAAK